MTIKLIVTDMDETFLREDKTYDKEKAEFVFDQLAKKDIVVAIASGNFVPLLEKYFDEHILNEIYLAGDDGNAIKNADGILKKQALDREMAKDIYHFITEKDGYYPVFSTGNKAYAQEPVGEWQDEQFSLYYLDYQTIEAFDDIPENEEIVKIDMLSKHSLDEIKEVMNEIEETFPEVTSVTSGEEWLDVYHKDGGKGAAVEYLQDKYNISKEHTMCFGDSLNDLSMMNAAKYSVAMENADDELKKHCNFEIGTNEDQAVLEVLKQLIHHGHTEFLDNYRK